MRRVFAPKVLPSVPRARDNVKSPGWVTPESPSQSWEVSHPSHSAGTKDTPQGTRIGAICIHAPPKKHLAQLFCNDSFRLNLTLDPPQWRALRHGLAIMFCFVLL